MNMSMNQTNCRKDHNQYLYSFDPFLEVLSYLLINLQTSKVDYHFLMELNTYRENKVYSWHQNNIEPHLLKGLAKVQ